MLLWTLLACQDKEPELPWGSADQWSEVPEATSWEWILDPAALPSPPPAVDWLGLDGLDTDPAAVAEARAQGSQVWCYLSVGSAEEWRDDYAELVAIDEGLRAAGEPGILGEDYEGWEGERWLDIGQWPEFFPVMEARLDRCAAAGFTHVEYDNMETFPGPAGADFDQEDVETYVRALVEATQARGMGAIHKNAAHLIELMPLFDALLLEDCVLWGSCAEGAPYLEAGKPVFNAEYPQSWAEEQRVFDLDQVCAASRGASTLIKRLSLNEDTIVCDAH